MVTSNSNTLNLAGLANSSGLKTMGVTAVQPAPKTPAYTLPVNQTSTKPIISTANLQNLAKQNVSTNILPKTANSTTLMSQNTSNPMNNPAVQNSIMVGNSGNNYNPAVVNGQVVTPQKQQTQVPVVTPQQQNTNYSSQNNTTTDPNVRVGGAINSGYTPDQNNNNNTQTQPTAEQTYFQGLLQQLAQQAQMTPEERSLIQQQADLKNRLAQQVGGEQLRPQSLEFGTGRVAALQNMANAQQQNLAEQQQSYEQQRQVAATALGTAAGLAKPGVLSPTDAYVSPFNNQAMGGNAAAYNRAQSGTNLQNNLAQGVSYGNQSTEYTKNINNLSSNFNVLQGVMNQFGINQAFLPGANDTINTIKTKLGNGGIPAFNDALNNVENSISALYASSSGGTPTGVQDQLNKIKAGSLPLSEIKKIYDTALQSAQGIKNNLDQTAQGYRNAGANPYTQQINQGGQTGARTQQGGLAF